MTVATTSSKTTYSGNGSTTAFATGFVFFSASEIIVQVVNSSGSAATKTIGTHYNVTGGSGATGTVTMVTAPASGETLVLLRNTARTQATALATAGAFPALSVEQRFDRTTLMVQEVERQVGQALQVAAHEAAPAALPALANRIGPAPAEWDASGNLIRGATNVTSAGYETGYLDVVAGGYVIADGTTDDTTGWRNAAATGRPLYFSGGTSKVTGKIDVDGAGQRILGHPERSVILGVGNFDTFEWGGGTQGGGIDGITFSSAGKTGGADFAVRNHNRFDHGWTRHISPWVAAEIGQTNVCDLGTIIIDGYRGDRGIYWVGTDAAPSLILRINRMSAAPSSTANKPALEINGACYTLGLNIFEVNGAPAATDMQYGLWAHNAIGATAPLQFCFGWNVQVDYPVAEGLRFDVGVFISLLVTYVQGSKTASGIRFGSAVNRAIIASPNIQGNALHGIITGADDLQIGPGFVVFNSLSKLGYYDGIYCEAASERTSITGTRIGTVEGAGGTHRYGLYAASGATKISMVGGSLADNIRGPYRDDSGVSTFDNFNIVGVGGVGHTWDGHTTLGSTAGFGADASITISGGVIQPTVTMVDQGKHYDVAPTVVAFDPSGAGSGATFTASVSGGRVTSISRTAGGSSYGADTFLIITAQEAPPALRALIPGTTNQNLSVRAAGTGAIILGNETGGAGLTVRNDLFGAYGAGGAAKPTVTGSRGSNAALASLCTALATLGLITDSTS